MSDSMLGFARDAWAGLQAHLFFLPAFPGRFDTLALLSLLLVTGLLGAVVGPWLLRRLLPGDDAALGTALGTCAHAIGTSRALQIGETCGAFSALAMGLNGLLTALLLPLLMAWWGG